jgi:hypothetical protein
LNDEFVVGWDYPDGYSAAFEQDDATGYFYALKDETIFQHLHIYNRQTQEPPIKEEHVAVIRSEDGSKVGVVIWRELRGIIKLETSETFKDNAGITEEEWLRGFNYQLRSDDRGVMRAFVEWD